MVNKEKRNIKQKNDMERIIALALVKSLYNQGKYLSLFLEISEVTQRRKFHLKIGTIYVNIKT